MWGNEGRGFRKVYGYRPYGWFGFWPLLLGFVLMLAFFGAFKWLLFWIVPFFLLMWFLGPVAKRWMRRGWHGSWGHWGDWGRWGHWGGWHDEDERDEDDDEKPKRKNDERADKEKRKRDAEDITYV